MGRRTRKEAAAAGAGAADQVGKVADAQSVSIRAVAAFLLVFAPVLCAIMWEDMFQYIRSWFDGMDRTGAASDATTTASPFTVPFSSTFATLSTGNDNGVLVAKVTAMAVLGLASITLGLLPLRLASWLRWGQHSHRKPGGAAAALHSHDSPAAGGIFLSLLLCFGGGVLMCTTFVHMLPEVQESFMELEEAGELEGPLEQLAHTAPHLLMCAGFFIMYIVEELVHVYLHWRSHGKKEAQRTVASPQVTEASQEFGEVKIAPLMSLKWDVQEKKSSMVVMAYADGTEVKSEVPPQFRVSAVTFANPWGAESEGEKQFLKVDAERPCCKGKPRVAKVSSKCHKVHHDHLEPDVTGNMPNFMSGANHHSHAIPASAAAPASHGHHDHHHDDDEEEDSVVSALRGLLIVMALSVHELFEGLAVGLEGSAANVWYMLAAVACHKLVIAFCIGVELVAMRTKLPFHFLYVATFALVSPLGIGVGILVTASYGETETGLVPAILQGLATGTLLYVVFFEILERQRACGHSGLRQYLAVLAGFLLMFGLSFIGGHSHSHSHGHGHSHAHAHVHAHDVMEHAHFDSNHSDGHAHAH